MTSVTERPLDVLNKPDKLQTLYVKAESCRTLTPSVTVGE